MIKLHRLRPRNEFAEGDGGGGATSLTPTPVPVETAATPAPASAEPAAPASAFDAMWNRDEKGRFAPKPGDLPQANPTPAAAPVAAPATVAAKPEQADDITAMPEGLGQKAQERFQKLANGIKERDEQIGSLRQAVDYVQQTFQQHNVTQPQFEQAVSVIGALNRGDFRGALAVLDEQRRQIALQLGESLPGVDALSEHPDLRQAVDSLHMTEAAALELARHRQAQQAQQRQQQQTQQVQQTQQQHREAVTQAQGAVDTWCQQMQRTDLDYPAIEAILLPELPNLLAGVPPAQWPAAVQAQYRLIKNSGAAFRRAAPPAPSPAPLRPNGIGGGQAKPSSLYDAMWNRPQA